MNIEVAGVERLALQSHEPLSSMYVLSPYVWLERGRYEITLRAVNRSDDAQKKTARVYHGTSTDSINFVMDDEPALAPGPTTLIWVVARIHRSLLKMAAMPSIRATIRFGREPSFSEHMAPTYIR